MLNNLNVLSDFINRILSAQKMGLIYIFLNYSNKIFNILKILKREGYIDSFFLIYFNLKLIIVKLRYFNRVPVIKVFKKFSKYNLNIYRGYKFFPRIMNGLGIIIVSTNKGFLTDKACKILGIGGELVCYVF